MRKTLAVWVLTSLVALGNLVAGQTSSKAPDKTLAVGFLVVDGVYNTELMAPFDVFHHTVFHADPGMEVFIVAPQLEPVITFEGVKILPDYSFETAPPIDVLVVPSAKNSMSTDLGNEELISFVRKVGKDAKYVMSLCDGAFVLAQAGLLKGRECTTFPTDIGAFRDRFDDQTVLKGVSFVHDGPTITSVGGAKSYDAALYLAELLYGRKVAEGIARGLVIDWDLTGVKFRQVEEVKVGKRDKGAK